jgi:hypothetical protein
LVKPLIESSFADGTSFTINSCDSRKILFNNRSTDVNYISTYDWEFNLGDKKVFFNTRDVEFTFPERGTYMGKMILNKDEVKLVDSKHVYEPGRVLTFDKRGKCKELNVEIYDELGNRYELEWYKNIRADNIWNIWDDGWEHDPNPLPKILDIISSVPPTYVTIYI